MDPSIKNQEARPVGPMWITRDALAFALGLTPRRGYHWPSGADGQLAVPITGHRRPIRDPERRLLEGLVMALAGGAVLWVVGLAAGEWLFDVALVCLLVMAARFLGRLLAIIHAINHQGDPHGP